MEDKVTELERAETKSREESLNGQEANQPKLQAGRGSHATHRDPTVTYDGKKRTQNGTHELEGKGDECCNIHVTYSPSR